MSSLVLRMAPASGEKGLGVEDSGLGPIGMLGFGVFGLLTPPRKNICWSRCCVQCSGCHTGNSCA